MALLHGGGQVEKRVGSVEGEMYNQPMDGKKLCYSGSQLPVRLSTSLELSGEWEAE